MRIHRRPFRELTPDDLYEILRLRSDVFVVEQACLFLELDDRDREDRAELLWTRDDHGVTGTARILHEHDDTWSVGRIVTRADVRSRGIGGNILSTAIGLLEARGATSVLLKAQSHLADWYARFGFEVSGPEYVEDGIPHVPMARRSGSVSP